MNNHFEEKKSCHLMVWSRNKRTEVAPTKFYVAHSQEVKAGDVISTGTGSYYEIVEVTARRESKMKGRTGEPWDYVETMTKHHTSFKITSDFNHVNPIR